MIKIKSPLLRIVQETKVGTIEREEAVQNLRAQYTPQRWVEIVRECAAEKAALVATKWEAPVAATAKNPTAKKAKTVKAKAKKAVKASAEPSPKDARALELAMLAAASAAKKAKKGAEEDEDEEEEDELDNDADDTSDDDGDCPDDDDGGDDDDEENEQRESRAERGTPENLIEQFETRKTREEVRTQELNTICVGLGLPIGSLKGEKQAKAQLKAYRANAREQREAANAKIAAENIRRAGEGLSPLPKLPPLFEGKK